MISASGKLTPAAAMRTTTWPGPATGSGTSSTASVSGRPWVLQTSARMIRDESVRAKVPPHAILYHASPEFTLHVFAMDLNPSATDRAFREEVRAFVRESLPPDISGAMLRQKKLSREQTVRWHKILYAHGWGAPSWPVEYGGTGWTAMQRLIFDEECAMAGAPRLIPFGLNMVAPVIMKFGNAWQKNRFLPKILSMDEWWCQGYSEPGAGSDLASLKTTAVRGRDADGEHYLVNGQKTWTTLGHF